MTVRTKMVLTDDGSQSGMMPAQGAHMAGYGYMAPEYYPPWGQMQPWVQPAAQSHICVSRPQYICLLYTSDAADD